jgi:aryl-alcohol dehydrogenase-like predicted oxidoreductase
MIVPHMPIELKADPFEARAVLGAGSFGGVGTPKALIGAGLDERGAMDILDRGVELGLTLIDTAHSYADGESERMIGRWLRDDAHRGDVVAIVDKVGAFDRSGEFAADLSPKTVVRCAELSRSRLGVDAVEVVLTHAPDAATPVKNTLIAFAELLEQGRARRWGVSNVNLTGLEEWLVAADELGVVGPSLVENEYSLLARGDEAGVIPLCRKRGIGYLAYSPLAGGVLSGKYRRGEPPPAGSRLAIRPSDATPLTDAVHDAIGVLSEHASAHGVATAALALAWVMAKSPTVRPIVGPSRLSHLDVVASAVALQLPTERWETITEAFDSALHA